MSTEVKAPHQNSGQPPTVSNWSARLCIPDTGHLLVAIALIVATAGFIDQVVRLIDNEPLPSPSVKE